MRREWRGTRRLLFGDCKMTACSGQRPTTPTALRGLHPPRSTRPSYSRRPPDPLTYAQPTACPPNFRWLYCRANDERTSLGLSRAINNLRRRRRRAQRGRGPTGKCFIDGSIVLGPIPSNVIALWHLLEFLRRRMSDMQSLVGVSSRHRPLVVKSTEH